MRKLMIILVMLMAVVPSVSAKDIDVSVTGSVVYDQGRWGSGEYLNPSGTLKESWVGFSPSMQIKCNRWKLQPTFEFNFRKEYFNFSNWEQHAHMNASVYSLLVGVTHDFKPFSGYLLVGVSRFIVNGSMAEVLPYPVKIHGKVDKYQSLLAFKVGAYHLWKLDTPIGKVKVGPEVGVMIYPKPLEMTRCRNISLSRFVPNMGLRVQW